jgi:hypothetical protein
MKSELLMITSIDEHSRMLQYADLVPEENSWGHIQAAQYVLKTDGSLSGEDLKT